MTRKKRSSRSSKTKWRVRKSLPPSTMDEDMRAAEEPAPIMLIEKITVITAERSELPKLILKEPRSTLEAPPEKRWRPRNLPLKSQFCPLQG